MTDETSLLHPLQLQNMPRLPASYDPQNPTPYYDDQTPPPSTSQIIFWILITVVAVIALKSEKHSRDKNKRNPTSLSRMREIHDQINSESKKYPEKKLSAIIKEILDELHKDDPDHEFVLFLYQEAKDHEARKK